MSQSQIPAVTIVRLMYDTTSYMSGLVNRVWSANENTLVGYKTFQQSTKH